MVSGERNRRIEHACNTYKCGGSLNLLMAKTGLMAFGLLLKLSKLLIVFVACPSINARIWQVRQLH